MTFTHVYVQGILAGVFRLLYGFFRSCNLKLELPRAIRRTPLRGLILLIILGRDNTVLIFIPATTIWGWEGRQSLIIRQVEAMTYPP